MRSRSPRQSPLFAACSESFPRSPESVPPADRIETLIRLSAPPLEQPVKIRRNVHLVPCVQDETDCDGAFAPGRVHAHAGLGRMEMRKRIAWIRIAEMAVPFTTDTGAAIRAIGFGRATPEVLRRMPP